MTDAELLNRVLSCIDPSADVLNLVRRNGRVLLGLPAKREAANRALGLYQPQRTAARMMVKAMRGMARIGMPGWLFPQIRIETVAAALSPPLSGVEPGSCGVLLGSPEHRVRRAIASYRNAGQWEVAKISFGEAGALVLEREARILEELASLAAGVPEMLGLHRGDGVTILRMPYLSGESIDQADSSDALKLLNSWITDHAPKSIAGFPEWPAIQAALSQHPNGAQALAMLGREVLRPVICHGDFARWNLLRRAGHRLIVLDWEWGHTDGMPGIDLVHYFLQDQRLVERLSPAQAIKKTCSILESPACRDYLQKTGWSADPRLPIIASLAYKQGAGHQENGEVLGEILNSEF